jgi:flagellar assembly protein FliH
MNANKFLFDRDFRDAHGGARNLAALQAAEERGFAQGVAEGRRRVADESEAQLASAMRRLADAAVSLLAGRDAHEAALEQEAIDFALTLGRKLAGEALRTQPLDAIAEAARSSLQHLRGVSHLVLRVSDTMVEAVDGLIQRIARERGYEGRLVVLGDPDIPPGDSRIEWADGGVTREQAHIERAVAEVLATARASNPRQ